MTERTVHAAGTDLVSDIVNAIGRNSSAGNNTVPNGVKYTRTGYLLYMVNKEGQRTSELKAFASPGCEEIPGSRWIATSRRGGTVNHFESANAQWGTPWTYSGGVVSNWAHIKSWFREEGGKFIDIWFPNNADKFKAGEENLVIELLMNFQYAERSATSNGVEDLSIYYPDAFNEIDRKYPPNNANMKKQLVDDYAHYVFNGSMINDVRRWSSLSRTTQDSLYETARGGLAGKVVSQLQTAATRGTSYHNIGDPLIGTLNDLIANRLSNVYDSYIFKSAAFALMLQASECGFTAYSGPERMLTSSEVRQYGVGMAILHNSDLTGIPVLLNGQATADLSINTPHAAPPPPFRL